VVDVAAVIGDFVKCWIPGIILPAVGGSWYVDVKVLEPSLMYSIDGSTITTYYS
jgi:hypothetical protein